DDTVLVMGDHRGESIDSRAYGPVPTIRLVGPVIWDF
ncbi:MAG: Signal peptidase peptidase, partial [Gaiellales bacterium]|nr:Signal peptidase peptidase [Gaiellales bacterium]